MGKSKDDAYKQLEDSVNKHSKATQDRKDIDQKTKDQIVLNNAAALDKVRKNMGIKE